MVGSVAKGGGIRGSEGEGKRGGKVKSERKNKRHSQSPKPLADAHNTASPLPASMVDENQLGVFTVSEKSVCVRPRPPARRSRRVPRIARWSEAKVTATAFLASGRVHLSPTPRVDPCKRAWREREKR